MRKIVMPAAGKSGGSVTIRKWLKRLGESFSQGEIIAQAESVEGLVELEASTAGVLKSILVTEGKTVAVGAEIAEVEDGAAASAAGPASSRFAEVDKKESVTKVTTPSGNAVPVLMPQVGNSMEEGTIVRWIV